MLQRAYVEITNVCNLRCSFCPQTRREKRFMAVEEFRHLAGKLRPYTGYLYLHVMGEPLLHPDLGAILDVCGEMDFRVCLTTNGTLLREKLTLLEGRRALHKVSVSLHSFEGNGGEEGLADYVTGCFDACRILSKSGVICALRLWNEGGENRLNHQVVSLLTDGRAPEDLPQDKAGHRKLGEKLFLESAEKFDWPIQSGQRSDTQFCHGLRRQIGVLCDGTVVPCCLDGEGLIPLGNLLTEELRDILASPRAAAMLEGFARRQPSEELCRRCGYARRFNV